MFFVQSVLDVGNGWVLKQAIEVDDSLGLSALLGLTPFHVAVVEQPKGEEAKLTNVYKKVLKASWKKIYQDDIIIILGLKYKEGLACRFFSPDGAVFYRNGIDGFVSSPWKLREVEG